MRDETRHIDERDRDDDDDDDERREIEGESERCRGEWEERGGPDLCAGDHQRGTRVRSTLCQPSGAGPP